MQLLKRSDLESQTDDSWRNRAYSQLVEAMTNKEVAFPCVFGLAAYKNDQLRFQFIETPPDAPGAISTLAAIVKTYVETARSIGSSTTLVVYFKEDRDFGLDEYQRIFWNALTALHQIDADPWAPGIPQDTNSEFWEYSFAGEPMFVVCNTPSHKLRISRQSSHFAMTFQPRWIFDKVIGPHIPNSDKVKATIRGLVAKYDKVPVSPVIGGYGEPGVVEWKQYFLTDTNDPHPEKCPFSHAKPVEENVPQLIQTRVASLDDAVLQMLPPTGSVEVHHDTPHRARAERISETDESIHVLSGNLTLQTSADEFHCKPSDRLLVPAGTAYASVAGDRGCTYVKATRRVPA